MAAHHALLLDEPVIALQPSLVRALGRHDLAAFVQQVHYAVQVSKAEHDGHTWAVRSNAEWCENVVLSPRQLERVLAELVGAGFVVRWQEEGSLDRRAWTRVNYDLLDEAVVHHHRSRGMVMAKRVGGSPAKGGDVPTTRSKQEALKEQPVMALLVPSTFDAFWQAYPRKTAKPAAEKAWRAIKPRDTERVMDGLATWCAFWRADRTEARFIPHPTTWLRQERWNDEPPPLSTKPGRQDVAAAAAGMQFDDRGRVIG